MRKEGREVCNGVVGWSLGTANKQASKQAHPEKEPNYFLNPSIVGSPKFPKAFPFPLGFVWLPHLQPPLSVGDADNVADGHPLVKVSSQLALQLQPRNLQRIDQQEASHTHHD